MDERVWYACIMDNGDGPPVGMWNKEELAQLVCDKQPKGHRDIVIAVVPAAALAAATERAEANATEVHILGERVRIECERRDQARRERDAAIARADALAAGIAAVQALIHDSDGVAGLHLNGEVAPWRDLLEGGNLEAWLIAFSRAVRLAEVDGEHPA